MLPVVLPRPVGKVFFHPGRFVTLWQAIRKKVNPEMQPDEISAPGWDAIDNALKPIYKGQTPKHYGTLIGYDLGGPDPLRGISAYKRSDPMAHWHFITYGFSELYDKQSENKEISGWGFELTLRLKIGADAENPPPWALNFLQNLARYVFQSGRVFQGGDYMNLNGPIALEVNTKIRSIAFAADPELPTVDSPNGRVQFIQVVGVTDDEELAIKQWETSKALEVFQKHLPLLVTDLSRDSLLFKPDVIKALKAGASADGSNTGAVFIDQLSWNEERRPLRPTSVQITMGARQVVELISLLPYRIPFQRPFELVGQNCQIAINPSEANGYRVDGGNLILSLIPQSAAEVANSLHPKEGLYEFDSFPALRIQVKKTFIKDQAGNVVNTIG